MYRLGYQLYETLDRTYVKFGNEAVILFKSLEALAVGASLRCLDPRFHDQELLPNTIQGIVDEHPVLELSLVEILDIFDVAHDALQDQAIPLVLELYGQEKMHYYPLGYTEDGIVKMFNYGTQLRYTHPDANLEWRGEFIK